MIRIPSYLDDELSRQHLENKALRSIQPAPPFTLLFCTVPCFVADGLDLRNLLLPRRQIMLFLYFFHYSVLCKKVSEYPSIATISFPLNGCVLQLSIPAPS